MLVIWEAITPIMTSPKWETQIMSHMVAIAGITNLVLSHSHQVTAPHLKVGNRYKRSKLPTKPMDQARDNISHKMVVFAWIAAVQHYFHKKHTKNTIHCVITMWLTLRDDNVFHPNGNENKTVYLNKKEQYQGVSLSLQPWPSISMMST